MMREDGQEVPLFKNGEKKSNEKVFLKILFYFCKTKFYLNFKLVIQKYKKTLNQPGQSNGNSNPGVPFKLCPLA